MDVEVVFDAPGKKTFAITSESGSKMLAERVFRRLMESEKEAAGGSGEDGVDPWRTTLFSWRAWRAATTSFR